MDNISIHKQVPVIGAYDVVVCGGGPAGFVSAIAAARQGASVALIERYGFLGGTATAGLVNPISRFRKNGELVIKGIPFEFIKNLEDIGGCISEHPTGHAPVDSEKYKLIAQRMVLKSGVALYLHSTISDVVMSDKKLTHIIIENKSGSSALSARYVIDCTGDADVAYRAGVPMLEMPNADEMQPASLHIRIGGVKLEPGHLIHPSTIYGTNIRKKLFELSETEDIPEFGGPWFCTVMNDSGSICSLNITRTAIDATNNDSITYAEIKLREDAYKFIEILKKHFDGFENCYLISTATQVGIRESRRIKGHHVLNEEEYASCFKFEDSIARGAHQMDIHKAGGAAQDLIALNGAPYIPYSSQYADGFPNLLVAGRCISAERKPFASLRVQATAMALGEAAGVAAVIALKQGVSVADISVSELQKTLTENGAII